MTYNAALRSVSLFGDYNLLGSVVLNDAGVIRYDGFPLNFGNRSGGRALDGLLDEVRLSNTILTTSQFLRASPVPEPASAGLLLISAAALLRRRRTH